MPDSTVARQAGEPVHARDVWRLPAAMVSSRTWLATIHLLAGLPRRVIIFSLVVTGVSLGIGLLPLFLFGIPVLAATVWMITAIAQFERARFALLLGETIQTPAPPRRRAVVAPHVQPFRTRTTWRQLAYCVLRLPVGVIDFSLVMTVWAVSLALVTLPVYDAALPGGAPPSASPAGRWR